MKDHINKVNSGEIDIVSLTKEALEDFKKINEEYNCFTVISEELALECAKNVSKKIKENKELPLAGVFVSIKDCICVKNVETTSTSRILKGYKPVFDATVVAKLKDAGAIIIGKTTQDEFGFGSFSVNVGLDYKIPKNPFNKERCAGGSSGGCGVITQLSKYPHISIAESTGGSIEAPATFCGVIGFCPTYGKVSRYGLLSYANSLDKIGVMGKTIDEVKLGLDVISGEDQKDSTSVKVPEMETKKAQGNNVSCAQEQLVPSEFKVGIIKTDINNSDITDSIKDIGKKLNAEEVELNFTLEYGLPAYYIIAMAEASTNLACLCGLRYGQQEASKGLHFREYFSKIRSEHFGAEVKRRIMLGTFTRMAGYRDAFYIRAAQARTKVIQEYKQLFEKYDILISPTMPMKAPQFDEVEKLKPLDHYLSDVLTVGPNFAGIPHMSFPINNEVGMMVMADHFNEENVLEFGKKLEALKNA